MIEYSLADVENQVRSICLKIPKKKYKVVYGIPKNGLFVAQMVSKELKIPLVDNLNRFHRNDILIVDDIVDTGTTIKKHAYTDCLTLISKLQKARLPKHVKYVGQFHKPTTWIKWFWEHQQQDKEDSITRTIQQIGEDASREGLIDTPKRVIKSFDKLYGGYKQNPEDVLKASFQCGYDEIILLRDISLFSTCEHHLLPFSGKCHIAYIPGKCGKVIGISKLARLMEVFARRMQIQEQLTIQIGESLVKFLKPRAVGVIIQASHMCMVARGVEKPGSSMVTSYMWGSFKNDLSSRQELLNLIKL